MKKLSLTPVFLWLVCFAVAGPFALDAAAQSGSKAKEETKKAEDFLVVEPEHAKLGTVFYVADPTKRNTVSFTSEAPLEDIIGLSNEIEGYVVFDPKNPEKGGAGKLRVPVKSLDTGIPLRDEHLGGADWLDAETHPQITFRVRKVEDVEEVKQAESYHTYDATLVGDFSIHGKTKRLEIPVRVTYLPESEATRKKMPGDLLAGRAKFEIALADYDVTGPEGMGIIGSKVGKTIQIEVRFTASTEKPEKK